MKRKKSKRTKKLLLLFIIFIIVVYITFCGIKFLFNLFPKKYIIETDNVAFISEIYIYGNHLNIKGNIEENLSFDEINLLFHSGEDTKVPLNYEFENNNINFYLGDKINNGYLIDNLDVGNYNLYIELINGNDIIYYKLKNNTNYGETEYYSIRKNNTQKKYNFQNKNDTINLNVKKDNNEEIYDIVLDPGHGGIDKGACGNSYCETDFTYLISSKVKEELEKKGLKVKLTRGDLSSEERLPNYGKNGRVNIANDSKAKYLFAIHLNSNDYNDSGIEIYTSYNIDYSFASSLASNIVKNSGTKFSTNNSFKVQNGVYTRTLQDIDLREASETAKTQGYKPYDIDLKTTYYFIIRETGGYMSGAYKDGRDGTAYNYYYNSNVGMESYLLELGYLTSKKDVTNIKNNNDKYAKSIAQSILNELEGN